MLRNQHLKRVVGCDETGFAGTGGDVYRRQAWRVMLSGGGLFNHLDYSFSVGFENGTDQQAKSPGAGSPELRKQIGILSRFFHQIDFVTMRPQGERIESFAAGEAFALGNETSMALYARAREATQLVVKIASGRYEIAKVNPLTGNQSGPSPVECQEGKLTIPIDEGETALVIRRR
jgi:hypothetical protein